MPHRFAEMVAAEQERNRKLSRVALKNATVNGLAGWVAMIVSFFGLPWHFSTVLWAAAVVLWVLAFFQLTEFIVNRNASRMEP